MTSWTCNKVASRLFASSAVSKPFDARQLSALGQRIGKCLTFGLPDESVREAGSISKELAEGWRELLAGSEGFLTEKNWRGMWRHEVEWGDMFHQQLIIMLLPLGIGLNGHVNNVVYNQYAESGRVNWATNFANFHDREHRQEWLDLCSPRSDGMILRSIRTDYKFPMQWPDQVTVYHKLQSPPTDEDDSFILDVVILSERHRRPAARCVEDIVLYDYRKSSKLKLGSRPFLIDALRWTYELQQNTANKALQRIKEIESRITAIEKASWDRPDAKEDFGSAS